MTAIEACIDVWSSTSVIVVVVVVVVVVDMHMYTHRCGLGGVCGTLGFSDW